MADVCILVPENNINGCELVLEESHCRMVLNVDLCLSTLCIVEFNILIF